MLAVGIVQLISTRRCAELYKVKTPETVAESGFEVLPVPGREEEHEMAFGIAVGGSSGEKMLPGTESEGHRCWQQSLPLPG